ncbi:MAG: MBL fold metallo-hydrolase [Christensenellales bacterium]
MELLFLGTGAATALPLPFCNCETCAHARAAGGKDIRRRSSVLIDGNILLDLGPDSVSAALTYGADFGALGCLLQTHAHSDHFDAGHLITRMPEYATRAQNKLRLFASRACISQMSNMLAREESGATLEDDLWLKKLEMDVQPLAHGDRAWFDNYEIIAVESAHDVPGGSLMYIVRRGASAFFYACDTPLLTDNAWSLLESLDFPLTAAAIDQTYGPSTPGGGHMHADQVAETAARLRCKRTYATHISHEGTPPHAALEAWTRARGYLVAYDGMRISV